MSKFKVGDKVVLAEGNNPTHFTVTYVYPGFGVRVRSPWDSYCNFYEEVLALVTPCSEIEDGDDDHPYEIPKDFRFFRRSDGAISQAPYPTFEAALEGWRGFAQNGDETEIVELISHGTYKATLKVEVVEPVEPLAKEF